MLRPPRGRTRLGVALPPEKNETRSSSVASAVAASSVADAAAAALVAPSTPSTSFGLVPPGGISALASCSARSCTEMSRK